MHNELYGYERITRTQSHTYIRNPKHMPFISFITSPQINLMNGLCCCCTAHKSSASSAITCTAQNWRANAVRSWQLQKMWEDLYYTKRSDGEISKDPSKIVCCTFFFHFGELKIERKKRQQQHFTRTQLWCSVLCNFIAWMDEWIDRWKRITMVRDAAGAT